MNFEFDPNGISVNWTRLAPLVIGAIVVIVVLIGLWTSFFTVQPEEEAVVKRFKRVVSVEPPGLHFKLPFGIDRAHLVPTARVLKEEFGFRTASLGERTQYRKDADHRSESLMLTGDLKVIDVEWVVQYRISDPEKWLHHVRNPESTIRDLSEAVMRRIVGNSLGSDVLTEKRVQVARQARVELQQIMDDFDAGVEIRTIELQDVTPPEPVKPAFNDVNEAEQERETLINQALKRRNEVIPRARGEAAQVEAEAEGYAAERINRARGEAERFLAILDEYRHQPEITRQRLYLEMIDRVVPRLGRIVIMEDGQMSPLPLLNLDDARPATSRRGGSN